MAPRSLAPDRPRVFGVGLNKTGTSSLHRALLELGFHSLHWGGPEVRRTVEASLAAGEPLLQRLDPIYDAFSDIEPLYRNVALLDEQYPGSRFILTVRAVDDWIDSRRRHVERNQARKAAGDYDGHFLEVDEPAWRADWDQHVATVRGPLRRPGRPAGGRPHRGAVVGVAVPVPPGAGARRRLPVGEPRLTGRRGATCGRRTRAPGAGTPTSRGAA